MFKCGRNAGSLKVLSAIALCRKFKEQLEELDGEELLIDWARQHHYYHEDLDGHPKDILQYRNMLIIKAPKVFGAPNSIKFIAS